MPVDLLRNREKRSCMWKNKNIVLELWLEKIEWRWITWPSLKFLFLTRGFCRFSLEHSLSMFSVAVNGSPSTKTGSVWIFSATMAALSHFTTTINPLVLWNVAFEIFCENKKKQKQKKKKWNPPYPVNRSACIKKKVQSQFSVNQTCPGLRSITNFTILHRLATENGGRNDFSLLLWFAHSPEQASEFN